MYEQKLWARKPDSRSILCVTWEGGTPFAEFLSGRPQSARALHKVQMLGSGVKDSRKDGKAGWVRRKGRLGPLKFPDGPRVDAALWKLSGPTQTSVGQNKAIARRAQGQGRCVGSKVPG